MSSDTPLAANPPPPMTIMSPPPPPPPLFAPAFVTSPPDLSNQDSELYLQIMEALSGKDRIYVLKLGEQMEGLINNHTAAPNNIHAHTSPTMDNMPGPIDLNSPRRIDLSPATSYQRMLVHRCCTYYGLLPETDAVTKIISVSVTMESRIPTRRLAELSPPPAEAPPKFKIMQRMQRSQSRSRSGNSVVGDDGDVSDVEASETGSAGGRSNASKHRLTIEERTAAYNEARNRIFDDFEEREKEQLQKTESTSSAASSSGMSTTTTSASDEYYDPDGPGSPATESEWSVPSSTRKHHHSQHPHRANSNAGSSRSRGFNPNSSSSSSRNSRASSPSFKYPSLYEPPPPGSSANGSGMNANLPPFDPAHQHHSAPAFGAMPQGTTYYNAPYALPQGYMHPHPPYNGYFAPPYASPYSHPGTPGSDPEIYAYNHNNAHGPYPWFPAGQPGENTSPPPYGIPPPGVYYDGHGLGPPPGAPPGTNNGMPPMSMGPNSNGIHHGPPNPYAPPYYPPPHGGMPPYGSYEQRQNVHGRPGSNRRPNHGVNQSNGVKRGIHPQPVPQRAAWSYGPGITGGIDFPTLVRDTVGPRLSGLGGGMRRGTRTTSGSGSSTGDDVSSVASSSTTSSSSRRTYTSNSSTQHHPLPARPDWAVGLRPNPNLHGTRHHSLPPHGSQSPLAEPPALTEFPPLTVGPPPGAEKAQPRPGGAWTNISSTRSIVMAPANGPAVRRPTTAGGKDKVAAVANQVAGISLDDPAPARVASPSVMASPAQPQQPPQQQQQSSPIPLAAA
ncbi:unnamed protein product [Mycena citricolor]|uniref:SUZ domain-containing protein n=1 Tax=Mycena citricolor TaxID=2018698 RepID=A0AAD2H370_9AGAR|nr:unnamed protein product [Mycena citricolor]